MPETNGGGHPVAKVTAARATTTVAEPAPFAALLDVLGFDPSDTVALAVGHPSRCRLLPLPDAVAAVRGDLDGWFAVNPHRPDAPGRGTAHVDRVVALHADLDRKAGGLPDHAAVDAVIADLSAMLGSVPVAVVTTRNGAHPYWAVDGGVDVDAGRVLLARWGRLVDRVARAHGGAADAVFDPARLMRAPGTLHLKDPTNPVPVTLDLPGGRPLTPVEVDEALDAYGVEELPEDRAGYTDPVDPAGWSFGSGTSGYVAAMVRGWATDVPPAGQTRHGWLLGQAVRLALAHRFGVIGADDHAEAVRALAAAFARIVATVGERRDPNPGEVADALRWGVARAASIPEADGRAQVKATAPVPPPAARGGHADAVGASTGNPASSDLPGLLAQVADLLDDVDDHGPTLFVLAAAVSAHDVTAEPLWGMLVGPPSSGKSERLRLLDLVADERVDELTAPGLLSWTRHKEPRQVGILSRLPDPALLTVSDFSTVLAMGDRGARDQLFAVLRRVHDGSVARDLGNAPGALRWEGRVGIVAAVTPAIDDYSAHADALGPRWLYCRLPDRAAGQGVLRADRARARLAAGQAAAVVVHRARAAVGGVEVDDGTAADLWRAAAVVAVARGHVPRDGYTRDVIGVPTAEEPYRLHGQMVALTRALLALGVPGPDAAALAVRCGVDTIPVPRTRALRVLADGEPLTGRQVGVRGGMDHKVAARALADLRLLGLASCPVEDDAADSGADVAPQVRRDWQLMPGPALDVVATLTHATAGTRMGTRKREQTPYPQIREGVSLPTDWTHTGPGGAA